MTTVLVKFEAIKRALAEARNIDEVKQIRNKAEALRLYVKQQGDSLEMQNDMAEIKLRAERRAGELLKALKREKGGRPDIIEYNCHQDSDSFLTILKQNEIPWTTASYWQLEAEVPEEVFERHIVEIKAKKDELTSVGLRRLAQKLRQEGEILAAEINILEFEGEAKYHTIVIDPPWPVRKILRDVRPNQDIFDYPTMTIEEIAKLPIADLAHPEGCHVYLWITHKLLPDGLRLFEQWGVKYQCIMTWVKNVGFTPFSWMYSTEHVLFGRIGSLALLKNGLRLDFDARVQKHSRKPDEFYQRVIEASPNPRIDLFAREPRDGFEAWGNET